MGLNRKAVEASKRGKIREVIPGNDEIIRLIGYIGFLMGLPSEKLPSGDQLAAFPNWFVNHMSEWTLDEIKLAFELCSAKKIDAKHHYQTLSPAYIGEVMAAYGEFKKHAVKEEKIKQSNVQLVPDQAFERQMKAGHFTGTLLEGWHHYLETNQFEFYTPWHVIYRNLFLEAKIPGLTPEMEHQIHADAVRMVKEESLREMSRSLDNNKRFELREYVNQLSAGAIKGKNTPLQSKIQELTVQRVLARCKAEKIDIRPAIQSYAQYLLSL